MPQLVIIGTIALDTLRTPFGSRSDCLGGTATYASTAAAFFTKPGLVSVIGSDFPEAHARYLGTKADLSGLQKAAAKTFRWSGAYEYDMNEAKTLDTQLNALLEFRGEVPGAYRDAPFVFLGNTDPELQRSALEQFNAPRFTLLDTMNIWIANKRAALRKAITGVDGFICNEWEARQLFDTPNLVKAARLAQALGPSLVVIKKGEHGALVFHDGGFFAAPGYPLENVVDPTGSGDTFAGGLMGWLAAASAPSGARAGAGAASEKAVRKGIIYGSILASYNAEGFGLERLVTVTEAEIAARYAAFQKLVEF